LVFKREQDTCWTIYFRRWHLPFFDCTFDSIYVPFVQNGFGFYHSNLLPLMLTAGIMGFLDIPQNRRIGFGIAFGLSMTPCDSLSQYREELKKTTGKSANLFTPHLQDAGEHVLYFYRVVLWIWCLCCPVLEEQLRLVD
jgi:hypothetical protein